MVLIFFFFKAVNMTVLQMYMTLLVSHFKLLSIFFDDLVVFMPNMKRFRESECVWMWWGEICVGRRSRHSFKSGNFFRSGHLC